MTLYVIPDLVWSYIGKHQWVAPSSMGSFFIEQQGDSFAWFAPEVKGRNVARNSEEAQSVANKWYKAKMAEGLKVATVEELRQAIGEV